MVFSQFYSVYFKLIFTAILLYIELKFHSRMSYRILNNELKKNPVTYDTLGRFPVTLKSVCIVTTTCGKHYLLGMDGIKFCIRNCGILCHSCCTD